MIILDPSSLQKGDTIGLIAPSSSLKPERLATGTHYLTQKGFNIKLGKHLHNEERFLAGKDEDRAADIMDFFLDPSIKAIMATAGGYGSQRLLPFLDYDAIRKHPKILTGFSDTTALQLGIFKKTGLISYTGFTFRDTENFAINELVDTTLMASFFGKEITLQEGETVKSGRAEGLLLGGNLECIVALMGTPYQPDFSGSILLIEDIFAEPYQTDCRLSQLHLAGIFDQAAGVIFGTFANCIAKQEPARDGVIDDVINEWSSKLNIPCIKNFPYGHIPRRCVLPIGKRIILDATNRNVILPGETFC